MLKAGFYPVSCITLYLNFGQKKTPVFTKKETSAICRLFTLLLFLKRNATFHLDFFLYEAIGLT